MGPLVPTKPAPRSRSLLLTCALQVCFLHASLAVAASTSNAHIDLFERMEYATLPPIVFAPTGRLHMVDRVGLAACNKDDATAGVVVALRCGGNDAGTDEGKDVSKECIVVVGTAPRSPLAIQASGLMASEDDGRKEVAGDGKPNKDDESNETTFRSALLVNGPERSIPSTTSILSPNLLVATGGTPTDAAVLLDRIRSVASDMHNSNFGGTGFTYQSTPRKGRRSRGGMFGVDGCNLARNVADMIQIPTQSIGTRSGSMLAASALIVDAASEGCNIWRIDPTGQFWSCDAAAVGKGAGVAESFLLKEIARRMKSPANVEDTEVDEEEEEDFDDDGIDDGMASLTNQDVKKFLLSLSVDEAIALAQKCVLKVYEDELKLPAHNTCNDEQDPSDADKKEDNNKPGSDFDSRAIISMGGAVLRPSAPTAKILDL